ncbi:MULTISPECIES: FAD-dependent monooxygenase [unclassified Micromonospora]|uniref:FAD-dependent monooxygenase n=1 Tax=unclassified Micromonospora TaxID=2617518 RepID=UPI0013D7E9BF|nr:MULTISPECIES: FAD-dependent monooxygenase [unclassified Micromonospora]NES15934.1 FAD-binding protein [Micromonospora sp. PPF5-17B]NES57925.1 FAD-binding protein [Micromonospora sp. PPF5-6]
MLPERTDVLVVGAGPTGLAAAVTLAGHGVRATVVDRLTAPPVTSRAAVVHAGTLEVLDRIGVAAPLVDRGLPSARFTVRDRDRVLLTVPFDRLPSRYPYALMVSQSETEAVLADRLTALGRRVLRPYELTGLDLDDAGATARFAGGETVRARWVIGADGMHSAVRDLAGVDFGGPADPGESFLLADARVESVLPRDQTVLFLARQGPLVWAPLPDGLVRLVAAVPDAPREPDLARFQALLDERGPARRPDRVTELLWTSRFRVHHRIAGAYRAGPVLLAGDAAHVHSPAGGQGMNLGLRDAVALGDALAAVLAGRPETLLDRYAEARRPLAEEVLDFSDRLTRLATVPPAGRPLRDLLFRGFSLLPPARQRIAVRLAGFEPDRAMIGR